MLIFEPETVTDDIDYHGRTACFPKECIDRRLHSVTKCFHNIGKVEYVTLNAGIRGGSVALSLIRTSRLMSTIC